ncbi:MAG: DUF2798 domain-containing protein [Ruminococcus callidus]|uniref:DUF2798 domain-containing protein n=1 Tax=Ruminococcus callidus TaxID=40519 RepID=UPI0039953091
MPKNKVQEAIFTILMVFVMVYAMICYNIAIETGGMTNMVFLHAFRELPIMGPIAFLLDFFLVGGLAKKAAFRIVDPEKDNPFHLVLAISAVSVLLMCPLMSLAATLLFKHAGVQVIAVWFETTAKNFPTALLWQLFFAGPLVRFVFRHLMALVQPREKAAVTEKV